MSRVRVHNFSISLDGFGTGDGLTLDAPFGHAGERLHEWMFTTRWWRSMVGEPGGSTGVDHAFAERHGLNIGAEIMGRGKFGPPQGVRGPVSAPTRSGAAGGGRTRRSTRRCSCSPIIRARRSRWRAAPCSTSSTPAHTRRSTSPVRRPATSTCASAAARRRCATSRRRPHRRPPRRAGTDPARPRRPPVGRSGRHRGALRCRGRLVTERRRARDVHASIEVCTSIARSTLARVLLNTHAMTIVNVMAARVKSVMPTMPPPPEEA